MKKLHRKDLNDKRYKKIMKPEQCDHSNYFSYIIVPTTIDA